MEEKEEKNFKAFFLQTILESLVGKTIPFVTFAVIQFHR